MHKYDKWKKHVKIIIAEYSTHGSVWATALWVQVFTVLKKFQFHRFLDRLRFPCFELLVQGFDFDQPGDFEEDILHRVVAFGTALQVRHATVEGELLGLFGWDLALLFQVLLGANEEDGDVFLCLCSQVVDPSAWIRVLLRTDMKDSRELMLKVMTAPWLFL